MIRHLRDEALASLGAGPRLFMRLGHHAEAEQAASYIGRQHRFSPYLVDRAGIYRELSSSA